MKIRLGLGKTNMDSFTRYCGGELYDFTGELGCDFEYVCTDSREADADTMFIATRGERVDGHDYIPGAIELGCRCILCEYVPQDIQGKRVAFSVVENSMSAFAQAARGYRSENPLKNIAITGSVGKTTTKELCAAILREKYKVYSTAGNFNSIIGMPMSLMEAGAECEMAVFEMGMSGFGEIRSMSVAAAPEIAMITNIGSSHLEYLGTRENIALAKLEIADGLREGGYLLLNADEPLLADAAEKLRDKKINILYATAKNSENAAFKAKNIKISSEGSSFDLECDGRLIKDIRLAVTGIHFVYNAMFACAAAYLAGATEEDMKNGLLKYRPIGNRQNIYDKNGIKIIADCYNAAPESMRAAIDVLSAFEGRKIAVLGDMKELGRESSRLHGEIGQYVVGKADMLFTLGECGADIAEAAKIGGMKPTCVLAFKEDERDLLCSELKRRLCQGDVVLFKASRAMELEKLIEVITE